MSEQLYFLINSKGQCWCKAWHEQFDNHGEWSIWKTNANKYTQEEIDDILGRNPNAGWAKIKAE